MNVKVVSDRRKLMGGAVGNFGEQFDYTAYALLAPTLAVHFFPQADPVAAMLSTFAVYALSFVARPFGGMIFGYVGDRFGRLSVLQWTVVLMGGGTMLMGFLPTYASIGLVAPALLVCCRLLQGLSIGGETTGVESFITESAPDGRRATWMTRVMAWAYWPAAIVAVVILGIRLILGDQAFEEWGWRIPFLAGGLVAGIGYYLRRTLEDPEEFVEAMAEARSKDSAGSDQASQGLGAAVQVRRSVLLVTLLQPPMAVGAYLLTGYMYTFVAVEGGLSPTRALLSNAAAVATLAILLPLMGRLSDRFGRRAMFAAGAGWLFVMAVPAFLLADAGSLVTAFLGQALLAIGVAMYGSAAFVGWVELFPTAMRCRGHGIAYNVSVALFGGTTPLIATALIGLTGSPVAPAIYAMALIGTFGLAGVLLVPETKHLNLRSSIYDDSASRGAAEQAAVAKG